MKRSRNTFRSSIMFGAMRTFVGIVFMCLSFPTFSQQPYYQRLSGQQGLPSSTIYDLFSSKEGYLYLGLENGLARFNGSKFTLFPIVGNRSKSMNAIQQSDDGIIWCMNFTNQLFFLDGDTLRPHALANALIEESSPLRDFLVTEKRIYLLTEDHLYLIDENLQVKLIHSCDKKAANSFLEIRSSGNRSGYFILDAYTVMQFNHNHELIHKQQLNGGHNTMASFNDTIIVSPKSNIRELQIGGIGAIIPDDFGDTYINKIVVRDNIVWLCTNTGLFHYEPNKRQVEAVYFENTRITDIVKDFEDGYWISSVDRGLFFVPNMNTKFYPVSEYNAYRIEAGPEETFIVGTGNGEMYQFSATGKKIRQLKTQYISEVEFIYYDEDNQRVITSHGIFDANTWEHTPIRLGKHIIKDDFGNYLLNTYNQALFLNQDLQRPPEGPFILEEMSLETYSTLNIPYFPIYKNRSNTSAFDKKSQDYYLGSYTDIYRFDNQMNIDTIRYNGKPVVAISMMWSEAKELIICTQKQGVVKLINGEIFPVCSTSEGLSSNTCRKALEKDNCLYILTDRGLDMYDLNNNQMVNISSNLSLRNSNIFDFTLMNDRILLATESGVITFGVPHDTKLFMPKLQELQAISIKNQDKRLEANVTLPYSLNNIQFIAEVIHFQNLNSYNFMYRLIGLDTNWIYQDAKNNTFNYLSLSPGVYTFELKMQVNGEESDIYAHTFTIGSPYWQKLWFNMLIVIFIVILTYYSFAKINEQQRKKQLIKQRLLQSQLVSLRSQMNPHFLFNVVNSVQGLIYTNKKTEASELLGKMSHLMRRVLEVSDSPRITLEREIDLLKNYVELEAARFDEDFYYEINNQIPHEERNLLIPSLIIQPFVENAIKHGLMHKKGEKKLFIDISKEKNGSIKFCIEDNGVGRKASRKINAKRSNHQPFASDALESRINLMNQANEEHITLTIEDLLNSNGDAKGTRIIITIQKHAK